MNKENEKQFRLFVMNWFRKTLGRPEPCFRAFTTGDLVCDLENYFQEREGKQVNVRKVWEDLQAERKKLLETL